MTLTELRDALAKAAGPDRDLDARLCLALGSVPRCHADERYLTGWLALPSDMRADAEDYIPFLTASIDAAVTLEGASPYVEVIKRPDGTVCVSWFGFGVGREIRVVAPTEPLARCLARVEYEIAKEKASA